MTWLDRMLPSREVLDSVRGITVHRALPQRDLPIVGPWCLVDLFGPTDDVLRDLPHPHTGVQTLTWPLRGEIRHKDSLGNIIVLKPGELNLLTSGDGVSHSEFSLEDTAGPIQALQLWVALPEDRRHGEAAFEHHADLPKIEMPHLSATVFMGVLGDVESPAKTYTPMVGAELAVRSGTAELRVEPAFEHAVMVIEGKVWVDEVELAPTQMLFMRHDRLTILIEAEGDARLLLIGGEPFEEDLVMWWNFVGRDHDEIAQARDDWQAGASRFGTVAGHDGKVFTAPELPHVQLTPRHRRAAP